MSSNQFPSAGQLEQLEHSDENHAKKVNLYSWDPATGSWTRQQISSFPRKMLIDSTSTTNVVYIGTAATGTATGAASWRIQKVDKSSSPTSVTYAAAGAWTAIWSNRLSETYS